VIVGIRISHCEVCGNWVAERDGRWVHEDIYGNPLDSSLHHEAVPQGWES
jgi:hypothetical protein